MFGKFYAVCGTLLGTVRVPVAKDPQLREVLYDAACLFDNQSPPIGRISSASAFDEERWYSWMVERTSGEFAGFPFQVVRLTENYPKRSSNREVIPWIVTTSLGISCPEICEAATSAGKSRTISSSGCPIRAAPNDSRPRFRSRTSPRRVCSLLPQHSSAYRPNDDAGHHHFRGSPLSANHRSVGNFCVETFCYRFKFSLTCEFGRYTIPRVGFDDKPSQTVAILSAQGRLFHVQIDDNYTDWDWDMASGVNHWWQLVQFRF